VEYIGARYNENMIFFWTSVFLLSLLALVKGSAWFIEGSEHIGRHLRMSPFIVGVVLVGVGTSLPELVSGIAGVFHGVPEVVVANAVGSNITVLLLVLGLAALFTKHIPITKDLIDTELPLFFISTVLFVGIAFDGVIVPSESVLLFSALVIYLFYSFSSKGKTDTLMSHEVADLRHGGAQSALHRPLLIRFFVGLLALLSGAYFLIQALIALSGALSISAGIIAITVVALGTSLPELAISLRAVRAGKNDIMIGNIFGSCAFNILVAVGIPGLFAVLPLEPLVHTVGLPTLAAATLIFVVSTLSKNIFRWEGMMFLLVYVFFLMKLFGVA
jgi:cation:H+ antiporter